MKTKPTGIRFEVEDLDFICKRENLKTPQSVVSFLMKEYLKLYRVEKQSIFSTAPKGQASLSISTPLQKDFKCSDNIKIARSFEYYLQARRSCQDEEEWGELKEEILNSDLTQKQKIVLTT